MFRSLSALALVVVAFTLASAAPLATTITITATGSAASASASTSASASSTEDDDYFSVVAIHTGSPIQFRSFSIIGDGNIYFGFSDLIGNYVDYDELKIEGSDLLIWIDPSTKALKYGTSAPSDATAHGWDVDENGDLTLDGEQSAIACGDDYQVFWGNESVCDREASYGAKLMAVYGAFSSATYSPPVLSSTSTSSSRTASASSTSSSGLTLSMVTKTTTHTSTSGTTAVVSVTSSANVNAYRSTEAPTTTTVFTSFTTSTTTSTLPPPSSSSSASSASSSASFSSSSASSASPSSLQSSSSLSSSFSSTLTPSSTSSSTAAATASILPPNLIIPVKMTDPNGVYGTQYSGTVISGRDAVETYISFDVPESLSSTVTSCKLIWTPPTQDSFASTIIGVKTFKIYNVADELDESSLSWNTRPTRGELVGLVNAVTGEFNSSTVSCNFGQKQQFELVAYGDPDEVSWFQMLKPRTGINYVMLE